MRVGKAHPSGPRNLNESFFFFVFFFSLFFLNFRSYETKEKVSKSVKFKAKKKKKAWGGGGEEVLQ